ncbi:MAG TPA: hypothetical protein VFV33_04305 [Gemmatimonadaceae bacterium]|nr:hypothetical protein [Gemmatimonadaceae bacterium]
MSRPITDDERAELLDAGWTPEGDVFSREHGATWRDPATHASTPWWRALEVARRDARRERDAGKEGP